ncbi:MAG: hypothetical protein HQM11_21280, partial [SAR324 cluster bacterium]|nr:hypothetical protein [SAR324 cluster bacterium]
MKSIHHSSVAIYGLWLVLLSFFFVMGGCAEEVRTPLKASTDKTPTVTVNIQSALRDFQGSLDPDTIRSVRLVVLDMDHQQQAETELLHRDDSVFMGELEEIPVNQNLSFIARAYDAANQEIANGTTTYTAMEQQGMVSVFMTPVSSQYQDSARIVQVNGSSLHPRSSTSTVSILVNAPTGGTLHYEIRSPAGGGQFYPTEGTITLSGISGTITVKYLTPDIEGDFVHTILLHDGQKEVSQDYSTQVISILEESKAKNEELSSIELVPISINATRKGNQIIWSAL